MKLGSKLVKKIDEIKKNEKYLLMILFCVLGAVTFLISPPQEKKPAAMPEEMPEIDEIIPPGLVLLPVELTNREALASIVGRTAVVDLLAVDSQSLNPKSKVASRVKLIRSPRNPDFFSILVEENLYAEILRKPGPYFALVQSRKQRNMSVHRSPGRSPIEVSYQE